MVRLAAAARPGRRRGLGAAAARAEWPDGAPPGGRRSLGAAAARAEWPDEAAS